VRRRDVTLNIDRALRAVAYALLGLTAPALVTPVRLEVGCRSTPPAFLYLSIVVLAARLGGFVRAVVVSASRSPISTMRSCLRSDGTGSGPWG
jgi:hypothetical protein